MYTSEVTPAVAKLCEAAGITLTGLPTATGAMSSGSTASSTGVAGSASSKVDSAKASATSAAASAASSAAAKATGAAVANGVGLGAVAFGVVAAML